VKFQLKIQGEKFTILISSYGFHRPSTDPLLRTIALEKHFQITISLNMYCHELSDCRRVLDRQLDLLDNTHLHTITVHTLINSQELSLNRLES
jgi:hypothetical protein